MKNKLKGQYWEPRGADWKKMPKKKHKTVRGTKNQKRPSASYYYKVLGKPVGYKTSYRPRKGGKMIKYSLQLRKNGSPYWKALTHLPKKTKKKTKKKTAKRS